MARNKGAGKKAKKAAARKPAARRQATRKPAASAAPAEQTAKGQQYPCNVLVNKGAEKIPVQVTDAAHHARLVEEFGEASIEVQS